VIYCAEEGCESTAPYARTLMSETALEFVFQRAMCPLF